MRTIILSAWNDVKRNKFFTILTMIEILVLVIVAGIIMQNVDLTDEMAQAYREEHKDAVVVEIKNIEDVIDDKGFNDFAASVTRIYGDINASVINPKMTHVLNVKHTNHWFSGDTAQEYKEAIVSRQLKDKYVLNEIYDISDGINNIKIKVIGYLGKSNMTINTSYVQYDLLFSNYHDIMICDDISKQEVAMNKNFDGSLLITSGYDKSYFIQNFNAKALTLQELKQTYIDMTATSNYYFGFLTAIIFAIIVVSVLCNSVFKTESNIRRNMVKYVAGVSRDKISATEIVKASAVFIIPWLIDLIFVTAVTIAANKSGDSSFPLLTWKGFWVSTAMVLGVYIVSTLVGLIRVIAAKPLEELKK